MTLDSSREALSLSLQEYFDSLVENQFVAAQSFAEQIAEAQREATADSSALYVIFYYDIDKLKSDIYMLSTYKAKNVRSTDKEPKSRFDEINITEDEEEMLNKLVKDAAKDVYKLLAAYGKDISSGYLYQPEGTHPEEYNAETVYNQGDLFYSNSQLYYCLADETPTGTLPANTDYFKPVDEFFNTYHKIVYKINYDSNMDDSMITNLNDDIEDCLLKHILLGWYKVIHELAMLPVSEQEYDDAVSKVRLSLWFRKKPVRRRTEII